jgi:ubiquinone/menaquinone biosynthesis C-methylase UbiE
MIALLDKQIAQRGITNVKPILGVAMDPGLAPASVDLAIMIDVYHEFQYPHEMLAAIVRALKPGGRLVFVEFRANDRNVPIKPLHTMTEAQVRKEAGVHALEWVNTLSTLPWQHLVIFRRN